MSEYQYVHFLALDRPLDNKQLEFMERQSSRAEITKWEFTNEYHFGDFHGNAKEMLRRGYDVHLHYANYGIRRLMFRLPAGLPWDPQTFDAYCPEYGIDWHARSVARGGGGHRRSTTAAGDSSEGEGTSCAARENRGRPTTDDRRSREARQTALDTKL